MKIDFRVLLLIFLFYIHYSRYKRNSFQMFLKNICLLYLIVISFFDLRTGRIPNLVTLGFFVLMLFSDIFIDPSKIPLRLLCAVFFFFLFFCIWIFTKGLGMGDVKLATVIGYYFGFFKTLLVFIFACFVGIMFFFMAHILKRRIKKLPFAPLVTAGYMISQLFCGEIL